MTSDVISLKGCLNSTGVRRVRCSSVIVWPAVLLATLIFSNSLVFGQARSVGGSVNDDTGVPLPGATVVVIGSDRQAIANEQGLFTISASRGELIQISFIGYESVNLVLGEELDLSIRLKESSAILNEVVVVGYGTIPRSDVTGAIARISTPDFVKGNVSAALQQAQGKIPGLSITRPDGDPNGDFNVRIRGATSLEGQPPLVVIDGVVIDDFDRAMASVNPNDIESYDVLKDASAAAIYGSRGANGVLIVTTKKGKSGPATFQYNAFGSIESASNQFDVLTRDEWLSATASDTTAYHYDAGGNTDWQKAITETAYTQSHMISVAGGSDHVRARGSIGYIDQEGIVLNTGREVLTTRLNADLNSSNEKLSASIAFNSSVINRDFLPDQTGTSQVRQGGAAVFTWAKSFLRILADSGRHW